MMAKHAAHAVLRRWYVLPLLVLFSLIFVPPALAVKLGSVTMNAPATDLTLHIGESFTMSCTGNSVSGGNKAATTMYWIYNDTPIPTGSSTAMNLTGGANPLNPFTYGTMASRTVTVQGYGSYLIYCNASDNTPATFSSNTQVVNVVHYTPSWRGSLLANASVVAGQGITYKGNDSDPENNQYMLTVCRTNSITAGYPGTCASGQLLCNSSATNAGNMASCTYTTSSSDAPTITAYGFVCNSQRLCNATAMSNTTTVSLAISITQAQADPPSVSSGSTVNISANVAHNFGGTIDTVLAEIYFPNGTLAGTVRLASSSPGVYWNASYVVSGLGSHSVKIIANDTMGAQADATASFSASLRMGQIADITIDGNMGDWSGLARADDKISDAVVRQSWTVFRANANNTGESDNFGPKALSQVSYFQNNNSFWTTPIIVDGIVYFGSVNKQFMAFNASNISQKLASYTTSGEVDSQAGYYRGVIYVGSDDHAMYALNASNVSQLIGKNTDCVSLMEGGVNFYGNSVYWGCDDNYIVQASVSSISTQGTWFSAGDWVRSTPAIVNGVVYIGSYDGKLYALSANKISTSIGSYVGGTTNRIHGSPAVAYDTVYFTLSDDALTTSQLIAVNASNVAQVFGTFSMSGYSYASPLVHNGVVYVGSNGNVFYALNASNISKQVGNFTYNAGEVGGTKSAIYADGVIYAVANSTVYALNASNISQVVDKVTLQTNGATCAAWSSPTVANGVLYLTCQDSRAYAIGAYQPSDPRFEITSLAMASSGRDVFAKVDLGGVPDLTNPQYRYRMYIGSGSSGTDLSPEGSALPFNYTTRVEVSGSACIIYTPAGKVAGYCTYAQNGSSFELSTTMTLLGMDVGSTVNVSAETVYNSVRADLLSEAPTVQYVVPGIRITPAVNDSLPANGTQINISVSATAYSTILDTVFVRVIYPNGTAQQDLQLRRIGATDAYYNDSYTAAFPPGTYVLQAIANETGGRQFIATATFAPYTRTGQNRQIKVDANMTQWDALASYEDPAGDVLSQQYWTMRQHDAQHTGYSSNDGPGTLTLAATYSTSGAIESSPVYANGIIYIGSDDGCEYALDATNISRFLAKFCTRDKIYGSAAIAGGVLYVGSRDFNLYALNASDISQQLGQFATQDWIVGDPTVVNGVVYVNSLDHRLYALNASNISQQLGNYTTGSRMQHSPAVANGVVYITSEDHYLYALNASNVSQMLDSYNFGTQAILYATPVVANGAVYVGTSENTDTFYALNASKVSQMLSKYTGAGAQYSGSAAYWNGIVYIGNYDMKMYAHNASNVNQVFATFQTGGTISGCPVIANERIYFGSYNDGKFWILNASNISQQIANYTLGGAVGFGCPAVVNGIAYIGAWDGKLYQFGTYSPSVNSSFDIVQTAVANNATHLFAKMRTNGALDLSATYYRLYFTNGSAGAALTPEGYTLPFAYTRMLQISKTACAVYNASGSNISECSFANTPDTIELAVPLTALGAAANTSVNLTFESAGSGGRYDTAVDQNSFLEYRIVSSCTPPARGEWEVFAEDHCILSNTNLEISGRFSVYGNGSMELINSNIIAKDFIISGGGLAKLYLRNSTLQRVR
jgi:outer membrane protein assembly factor BamB